MIKKRDNDRREMMKKEKDRKQNYRKPRKRIEDQRKAKKKNRIETTLYSELRNFSRIWGGVSSQDSRFMFVFGNAFKVQLYFLILAKSCTF